MCFFLCISYCCFISEMCTLQITWQFSYMWFHKLCGAPFVTFYLLARRAWEVYTPQSKERPYYVNPTYQISSFSSSWLELGGALLCQGTFFPVPVMLEGLVQWPQHLLLETPGSEGSAQGNVSMCHRRSLPLVWSLLLTLPFCTTTPAARWASHSLGSVPGCLQEGFYGNQGQEKPACQVQCSNARDRRAGRGVIPSKVEARAWWLDKEGCSICYTYLGTRGDSLNTLLPCFQAL